MTHTSTEQPEPTPHQGLESGYPQPFIEWAKREKLWSESHGLVSHWRGLDIALKAWKASQAQRAPLSDALAEYDKVRDHVAEQVGCFDGGCLVKRPKGMHTNGGCKCSKNSLAAQRMMYAGQRLAEAVRGITQENQG